MAIEGGEIVEFPLEKGKEYSNRSESDVDAISDALASHILSPCEKPEIAILIPAYNEELTIGSVVLQARKHARTVIVVNDGSKDKTSEIARAAGAEVIEHIKNEGKAAALRTGFNELKKRDYETFVMMDGDGQHLMADIDVMIAPLLEKKADLVIGSRFLKKDNSIPYYRQVGQRVLNRMTNVGTSEKVTDTQSGFRAFNRKALDHMDFPSQGYAVEQDMILHCSEKGLRIIEVPISVRYDVPNGHKQNSFRMGVGLLNNIVTTIGYRRPLILFGIPGVVLTIAGLIIGLLTIFEQYFIGSWMLQGLLAGFMVIVGCTLAVSALSLNSLSQLMRMNKST